MVPPEGAARAAAAVTLGAAFLVSTSAGIAVGHGSARAHMHHYVALEMGRRLAAQPPQMLPAAWNSGVLAWYADRPLVNLDGVVNDDALAAIRAGRLWDFILERGITRIVEEPGQLEHNVDRFSGRSDWRDRLGPPILETADSEGRRIVARPVLRDPEPPG